MKEAILKMMALFIVGTWLGVAGQAAAMSEHGNMSHGDGQAMDHSGMEMGGDDVMLGQDMQEGVKGIAHLRDIREAMAKVNMEKTHHFMVMFEDAVGGSHLDAGVVALKVVAPDGRKSDAAKLMSMDGSFGADVTLSQKGKYVFELGTKLADGKKRQFSFQYIVE